MWKTIGSLAIGIVLVHSTAWAHYVESAFRFWPDILTVVLGTVAVIFIVAVASLIHGFFSIWRMSKVNDMVEAQMKETRDQVRDAIRLELQSTVNNINNNLSQA